jgi:hypothetical protein
MPFAFGLDCKPRLEADPHVDNDIGHFLEAVFH